jgi:hypothetical protein
LPPFGFEPPAGFMTGFGFGLAPLMPLFIWAFAAATVRRAVGLNDLVRPVVFFFATVFGFVRVLLIVLLVRDFVFVAIDQTPNGSLIQPAAPAVSAYLIGIPAL